MITPHVPRTSIETATEQTPVGEQMLVPVCGPSRFVNGSIISASSR